MALDLCFVPPLDSVLQTLDAMPPKLGFAVSEDQMDGVEVVAEDSRYSYAESRKPNSKGQFVVYSVAEHRRKELVVGSYDRGAVVRLGKLRTRVLEDLNLLQQIESPEYLSERADGTPYNFTYLSW